MFYVDPRNSTVAAAFVTANGDPNKKTSLFFYLFLKAITII
jgi:hypothetical protein